jgi:hypothetical protein
MKIRMSRTFKAYELYDTIEINKNDYPELEGLSDDEAFEYIKENMWDFSLVDSSEDCLASEFQFNKDIIKDKTIDEEYELYLLKEDNL